MSPGVGTIEPAAGAVSFGGVASGSLSTLGDVMVDPIIYKIAGYAAPILSLMDYMRSTQDDKIGYDMEYKHFEKKQIPRYAVLAADAAAATTTGMTVSTGQGQFFTRNLVCKNMRTGEQFMHRSAVSTDTLGTVVRGYEATAAQDMLAGDVIMLMFPSRSEGQKMGDIQYVAPSLIANYANTMAVPFGATEHALMMKMLAGGDVLEGEQQVAAERILKDAEFALIHGQKKKGSYDQSAAANIGGFGSPTAAVEWIGDGYIESMYLRAPAANTVFLNGTVSFRSFMDDIIGPWIHRDGISDQLVIFHGQVISQALGTWKKEMMRVTDQGKSTEINLRWTAWDVMPGKTVTFVYHSGLNKPNVGTGHQNEYLIGMDFGGKHSPILRSFLPTIMRKAVLADLTDARAGEYKKIFGAQFHDCTNHLLVENVTDYE